MGEVYLAEDTELGRKVALKVLLSEVADNEDRVRRFVQEAKAASALNHPNILTVYEIGSFEDSRFIATELIKGETLREQLREGPLTLRKTLSVVLQVAGALTAAHEAGIIHRDIKPENIMSRADGLVKVLDFGLAKLSKPSALANSSITGEEAQTRGNLTQPGLIMGTIAYMSPEQARGQAVDNRTDIFSLGVVLYEMLTGRQPFTGETISHTIVAILEEDPPSLSGTTAYFPAEVERIISKCLAKNAARRYQTANDVVIDLTTLQTRLLVEAEIERSSLSDRKSEAATQIIKTGIGHVGARNSIAVLPFTNMSVDSDNEHFCDGLAEELLNALAKIDDLKVAARTSAFSFKGKYTNVSDIGQALGVKTVLEGSVRKSGNRLRISVQLVNASDGFHLWSERYDREMQDIFDVQDEITLAVVDALKVKLLGHEKKAVLKRHTRNAEAYQHYLHGRFFYFKRTPEGFKKAIKHFEQAIEIDSEYAIAVSGLADCYTFLGFYEVLPPAEAEKHLKPLAKRALALDDSLAETRISVALCKRLYDWNFIEADQEHKKAIALNPKYAAAHHSYAATLILMGLNDEAIAAEQRAIELEPFTAVFNASLGWWHHIARRTDEAIVQSLRTIEIAPNHFYAHWVLGIAYGQDGKFPEAISALQKAVALTSLSQYVRADLGRLYANDGQHDQAFRVLTELTEQARESYVSPVNMAKIYLGLGELELVFEWLVKACEERSVRLPWFIIDPALDNLRGDSRFKDLLRRVGLPQRREH